MFILLFLTTSAYSDSININGWWGFDNNGCNDADNQYRVALGKWKIEKEGIKFGEGSESIGLYDGTCELSNKKISKNKIEYQASCNLENEKHNGIVKITFNNIDNINLVFPGGNPDGSNLVRCITESKVTTERKSKDMPDIDDGCISDTITLGQLNDCHKANIMKLIENLDNSEKILKNKLSENESEKIINDIKTKIALAKAICEKKPEDDVDYCFFDEFLKIDQELKNNISNMKLKQSESKIINNNITYYSTAEELQKRFSSNELAISREINGREIAIEGKVLRVVKDGSTGVQVKLITDSEHEGINIMKLDIDKDSHDKAAELDYLDVTTIICKNLKLDAVSVDGSGCRVSP